MVKKILFLSDTHCGHLGGLTPPGYRANGDWGNVERQGWDMFIAFCNKYGPFHQCICVGDIIDGPGNKNNARGLITSDMKEQCDMAIEAIEHVPFTGLAENKLFFVRGTEYHTDRYCSFEDFIAKHFRATITNHMYHIVDNCCIDVKHKGSVSAASLRNVVSNAGSWYMLHGYPMPDVIVRGHIHAFQRYEQNGCTVITLPGVQMFSDYGERNVDRNIDVGFCALNVEDGQFRGNIDTELARLSVCGRSAITRG